MSRWQRIARTGAGDDYAQEYAERFRRLAARGPGVHGEADFVTGLAPAPARVLDAGCGTGRVAIELDRRGHRAVGVDRDPDLLATARSKAPGLRWIEADLADLGAHLAPGSIDLAVLAGNVLLFTAPGTEAAVVAAVAATVRPGGLVVAGFQLRASGYGIDALDAAAGAAGLALVERWATWDRQPWTATAGYQVSVHRRAGIGSPAL